LGNKKIPAEIYSRVVGYFRPVQDWNRGKKEEFSERKDYSLGKINAKIDLENKG
jgi:anaerobic ribonucleoside-triphosphate reductase